VAGAGNSSVMTDYTYSDYDPPTLSYYRLSQTDFNGARSYFYVISVVNTTRINIFPNPFNESIIISGILDPSVVITNGSGQSMTCTCNKINTQELSSGYYVIEVFHGNKLLLLKRGVFVK